MPSMIDYLKFYLSWLESLSPFWVFIITVVFVLILLSALSGDANGPGCVVLLSVIVFLVVIFFRWLF